MEKQVELGYAGLDLFVLGDYNASVGSGIFVVNFAQYSTFSAHGYSDFHIY